MVLPHTERLSAERLSEAHFDELCRMHRDERVMATLGGADEVELAYAVMAEFWGRGLASEMALASLQLGFAHLGLAEIVAFTLTTNAASRRVMEKIGFRFERDIVHAGLPHVLYRRRQANGKPRR